VIWVAGPLRCSACPFPEAVAELTPLGNEPSAVRLRELATHFQQSRPGDDWDAITDFQVK